MKNTFLLLAFASASCFAFQNGDAARWEKQAKNVTIVRDDWGIAHVYGKTDADTVFGMIYAQAEDDFNRVETNYINAMGRLAEAEGESKIYQDLRMKMFIDPAELKKQYAASPGWLQKLMNAFADGLNYYLAKHPEVTPRVIKRFEPWMALSFTEGSIGVDFEKVNLTQLQDVLRKSSWSAKLRRKTGRRCRAQRLERHGGCAFEHGCASLAAAHQSAHFVLLPV